MRTDGAGRLAPRGTGNSVLMNDPTTRAGRSSVLVYRAEWQTLHMRRNMAESHRLFRPRSPVIPSGMPKSSHKDVKLGVATKAFSNT